MTSEAKFYPGLSMGNVQVTIGVIGGNMSSEETYRSAYDVGKFIAQNNAVLVCGGLGGIMEAASKGASENGGTVLGILPSGKKTDANEYVDIAIPTGMGLSRNALVVQASDVCIAFPGSYGTLSEMAIALNLHIPVVYLPGAWNLTKIGQVESNLFKEAFDPYQAVGIALSIIKK
jgi:hypothetical protein